MFPKSPTNLLRKRRLFILARKKAPHGIGSAALAGSRLIYSFELLADHHQMKV
ncbi:MAG: hypothetical protein ACI9A7_000418 [Cyclobacteriaceae bacterium]